MSLIPSIKNTIPALVAGAALSAFAFTAAPAFADSHSAAGSGTKMERGEHGKRGGRMMGRLCNEERAAKRVEMQAQIPETVTLTPEQTALFNSMIAEQQAAQAALAPTCTKIEEMRAAQERNREARKAIGEEVKAATEESREATRDFMKSLDREQRQALRELMPKRGKMGGERKGKRRHYMEDDS